MYIEKLVKNYYEVGKIVDIKKTTFGSGDTFIIVTESDNFLVKLNNKKYEIKLYNLVQNQLSTAGINQPRIIRLKSGDLIGPNGIVMYEYIEGETFEHFDKEMETKALEYIFKYNQELKKVKIEQLELEVINDWDRIRSLDYICNEVYQRIINIKIDQEWKEVLFQVIEILNNNKNYINKLPKQLIHSDLSADNFIVSDGKIHAVIDFSPDIKHELYSLSQFVYWNYMWCTKELEKREIDQYFENYYSNVNSERVNKDFYILLFLASVFRTLGPLFEISKSEIPDYRRLTKRIELIKWIMKELIYVEI